MGTGSDFDIVKLITVAQISEIFIVNDVGLVGYSHAASREGTLVYH